MIGSPGPETAKKKTEIELEIPRTDKDRQTAVGLRPFTIF